MKTRRVALIIPYDEDGRILLQDRRHISKVGEEWGFFGGEIEEGESPEEAVKREAQEELDFVLENPHFIGTFEQEIPDLRIEAHVFLEPLSEKENLEQREGHAMQFFSIEEAKELKMVGEGDKRILAAVEEEIASL